MFIIYQIHQFLIEKLEMPEELLDSLCIYADAQGILQTCTEQEVAFKPYYARNMLGTAVELYRWSRNRSNVMKVMHLQPHLPVIAPSGAFLSSASRRTEADLYEDEGDTMETTDVAAEEEGN